MSYLFRVNCRFILFSARFIKPLCLTNSMGNKSVLAEMWDFLKIRKVWWLTPIIVMIVLVGVLIVISQSSSLSPFIYALF